MVALRLGMFAVFAMLVAIGVGYLLKNKIFVLFLGAVGAFVFVVISAVMCSG